MVDYGDSYLARDVDCAHYGTYALQAGKAHDTTRLEFLKNFLICAESEGSTAY